MGHGFEPSRAILPYYYVTRFSLFASAPVWQPGAPGSEILWNGVLIGLRGTQMNTQAQPVDTARFPDGNTDTSRSGIFRTGRRTRVILGAPTAEPASAHLQVFTWFTGGRDWVRIEIRHATDSGMVIQTAVENSEMDPRAALEMATELASRYGIRFVYFLDALPDMASMNATSSECWQVRIP